MNNENQNTNELLDNKKQEEPVNVSINDQQVNQNPENNEKTKKTNKGRLIIFGVIIVVLLVVVISINLINKNNQEVEENNSNNTNNDIGDNSSDESTDNEDEENEEDAEYIDKNLYPMKGYDGYSIEKVDNDYYLMHNNKKVAKLNKKDRFKLYKDESDPNSKYIAVGYGENYSTTFYDGFSLGDYPAYTNENKKGKVDYAFLSLCANVDNNDPWYSILYNVNTGKSANINGLIVEAKFETYLGDYSDRYLAVYRYPGNGYSIIDLQTYKVINDEKYFIIGNKIPQEVSEVFVNDNSSYLVVNDGKEDNPKYGLIDFNNNLTIDLIYDDLVVLTDKNVILGKKDNKFGAVSPNGKVLVDFKYDGIDYLDGYYAVVKNNKLGVLDKNGKEIIPLSIEVADNVYKEFFLRLCCSTANSFRIEEVNDKELIVGFLDKDDKGGKDSVTLHPYDYLVVSKDGKYKVYDKYKDYN